MVMVVGSATTMGANRYWHRWFVNRGILLRNTTQKKSQKALWKK